MTDRDRLIELIGQAKTEITFFTSDGEPVTKSQRHIVDRAEVKELADYLLANGVIVPPCKVGETVWWVTTSIDENCEENPDIEIGKVASFSIQPEGLWAYCRYESGLTFWHLVADYFGKTVFLTKEEAEAKLKELQNG